MKEIEHCGIELAGLAQQEQMCLGMCDALNQKANAFTRIVVIDDVGVERWCGALPIASKASQIENQGRVFRSAVIAGNWSLPQQDR